jgi:hypothetical protein
VILAVVLGAVADVIMLAMAVMEERQHVARAEVLQALKSRYK